MKSDEIPIPAPCTQPWDEMRRVAGGRYCEACRKTVVDLSTLSPRQVRKLIRATSKEPDPARQLCASYLRSADGEVMFERRHGSAASGPRKGAAIALLVAACNGEPESAGASPATPPAARTDTLAGPKTETQVTPLTETQADCALPVGPDPVDEPTRGTSTARPPRDFRVVGWVRPQGPAPAYEQAGTLRVNTRPSSKVFVDGRLVGPTPLMGHELPAGKHRVLLVNDEFDLRKVFDVEIRSGERATHVINFPEADST